MLGGLGSLSELTSAISSTMYAGVLAKFTSAAPPLPLPGAHFMLGATFLIIAFVVASRAFAAYSEDVAKAATGAGE